MKRGRFITLEGIDGAGKSTHVQWLADQLVERGLEVVQTREPGGTELGEALRELLLSMPMDPVTEALLMFAARAENVKEVIEPALARGAWVVCDRFSDATFAYQGGGKGVARELLLELERSALKGLAPDRTFLFDLDPKVARTRLGAARAPDRFERENEEFFSRVRSAYLERAAASAGRVTVIDAELDIPNIHKILEKEVSSI